MKQATISGVLVVVILGVSFTVHAQPTITAPLTSESKVDLRQGSSAIKTPADQHVLDDAGTMFQPFGNAQYGVSAKLWVVHTFGIPACNAQNICVERPGVELSIDANIIDAIVTTASAAREYMFSKKGSPLSVTIPFKTFTSRQGPDTLRQTWFGFQPYASARWIPVTGSAGNASGAVTGGFTVEMHTDFEAGQIVSGTNEILYPGSLFASVSPTIAAPFGVDLKTIAFSGTDLKHAMWGIDARGGFQFKGKQPVSVSVNATWTPSGFSLSHKSVGISFSKVLGQ